MEMKQVSTKLTVVSPLETLASCVAFLPLVDASGVLPKYHIPARFVTLIPREMPASQTNNKKRKSLTVAQLLPNAANDLASPASVKSVKSEGSLGLEDGLGGMVNEMGLNDLITTDSLDDFGFDFSEE